MFYEGRIAGAVAGTVSGLGGLLAAADLAEHSSGFEPPITVRYGTAEVSVTPPVSMGWVLLQLLLLYDRLEGRLIDDEADRIDLMVRCKHAAFSDLALDAPLAGGGRRAARPRSGLSRPLVLPHRRAAP